MSISFAANLSALRRERNLTQKTAAEELGISQALLSHYEKGIRECNLDFVRKAAEYYGVTSDYLLGITDSRHTQNELFDSSEISSDTQAKSKTLLRAFLFLLEHTENDTDEIFFNDFFSLAIEKYLAMTKGDIKLGKLCDIIEPKFGNLTEYKNSDLPLCVKTVDDHAKKLIAQSINDILE